MAGSRKPGPVGLSGEAEDLNDGTMIRALSPRPGHIGTDLVSTRGQQHPASLTLIPLGAARRKGSTAAVQVLQQGSRGSEVKKLQRQLNVRLLPSPNLTVDGIFGSITQQAVLQYQKGVSIVADGVVGKQTWYHLLKGEKATILQAPNTARRTAGASPTGTSSTIRQSLRAAPTPALPESIWELPIEKKLLTVLERVPSRLPGRARDEFTALLQLENLALSLAIIAGFCLLSGGTALLLGIVIIGFDMTISLASALQTAALAATEDELNEAADELAHIVLAVGVVAFIHGVGKIAKGARGAGKGGASEAQPKPMPEEAKPRPRQSRPVSGPAKPVESPTPEQRLTSNAATALENSRYGGVKAVRVRPGVSDKIAVIGRSMDDAVGPYAKGLQEKGLNVETFSTKKISQGAKDEWAMLKEKYAPERIPEDVIPDTRMFQENQAWARKLKDQGYTVVDVGNPGRQSSSPFYEMEKEILFGDGRAGGMR